MKLPYQRFLEKPCHKCKEGRYINTYDFNEWWVQCDTCRSYLFCYVPMPHQYVFHSDKHKFRMYAGGFGSAKTSTCGAEMVRHALETPKGRSLVGAQTYVQLEETAKKQILEMIPSDFIEKQEKKNQKLILKNGHEILFRSFDDEGKMRSLNLTAFWIEEASEVDFDIFSQLQTRLRNHATENHIGILSTNPDVGWIRSEFLLKSDKIVGAKERYYIPPEDVNPNFATFIAPTKLNKYLPYDYVESVARGKPDWWIRRYLEASFSYSEGAVYPNFNDHIIEPFDIHSKILNEGWETIHGVDFGLRDPTVMISGAIDPINGVVYLYDEYYKTNQTVPYHAKEMRNRLDWIPRGLMRRPIADPSGKKRNINDKKSLFDHYAEYGLWFKEGDNRIETGIFKVQSYLAQGKLKIFNTLENTIREANEYKYKPQELDSKKNADEKPIDKNNHTMDCLRYMIQELPDDPAQLKTRSYDPYNRRSYKEDVPFALQSEKKEFDTDWYNYY